MIFDEKLYLDERCELVNTDSGTNTVEDVMDIAEFLDRQFSASGWIVRRVDLGL